MWSNDPHFPGYLYIGSGRETASKISLVISHRSETPALHRLAVQRPDLRHRLLFSPNPLKNVWFPSSRFQPEAGPPTVMAVLVLWPYIPEETPVSPVVRQPDDILHGDLAEPAVVVSGPGPSHAAGDVPFRHMAPPGEAPDGDAVSLAPGKMKVDTEKVPTFIFCCRIGERER